MRIVTVVGTYNEQPQSLDPTLLTHKASPPGLLEIKNTPPPGLENPDFEQAKLDENVFLIETDDHEPNSWSGCLVFWRGKRWRIDLSQMISNGEGALLSLVEIDD